MDEIQERKAPLQEFVLIEEKQDENIESTGLPSMSYKQIVNVEKVNRAFDVLFEEVLSMRNLRTIL